MVAIVDVVSIVVNAVVDVDFGAVKQLPPRLFFYASIILPFFITDAGRCAKNVSVDSISHVYLVYL